MTFCRFAVSTIFCILVSVIICEQINDVEVPVCTGGFYLNIAENKTYCIRDAARNNRPASEVTDTFQVI